MSRPIQKHELQDQQKLYEYLQSRERKIEELQARLDSAHQAIAVVSRKQNEFKPTVNVQSLPGELADPQHPIVYTGAKLPDPKNTNYTLAVITGTPNKMYYLNRGSNPPAWTLIVTSA